MDTANKRPTPPEDPFFRFSIYLTPHCLASVSTSLQQCLPLLSEALGLLLASFATFSSPYCSSQCPNMTNRDGFSGCYQTPHLFLVVWYVRNLGLGFYTFLFNCHRMVWRLSTSALHRLVVIRKAHCLIRCLAHQWACFGSGAPTPQPVQIHSLLCRNLA